MAQMIADALRDAWQNFLAGIALFLPRVLATLSILVAGWLIAWLLGTLTRRVLGWLKFNALTERTGGGEMLRRSGLPPADALVGSIVYWLTLIGFVLSGLGTLGLSGTEDVVAEFLHFVPQLVIAFVILAVGFAVANFVWRATLLAAVNAKLPSARMLSAAARFMIMLLAVAMALEQVAVARAVVLTAFAIAFGALMLGVAIAIGIGGADMVRRTLEEQFRTREPRDQDPAPHL